MYFKTHLHSQTLTLEQFPYDLEWTLHFPTKEKSNMEKELFNWPIMLQFNVKAKYRFISRSSSGMKFFQPTLCLTNQKPRAFVSSTSQSNRSIPFVVSVLFTLSFQDHTKIAL